MGPRASARGAVPLRAAGVNPRASSRTAARSPPGCVPATLRSRLDGSRISAGAPKGRAPSIFGPRRGASRGASPRREGRCGGGSGGVSGNFLRYSTSSGIRRRARPTPTPLKVSRPMRMRMRSRTLCERRASMRRAWRLRPSRRVTSSIERCRLCRTSRTCAGRVRPSASQMPRRSRRMSSFVTSPATMATYVFGTS